MRHNFNEKTYKAYLSGLMQNGDMPGLMDEYIYIQEITVQSAMRSTVIYNKETYSAAITRAGVIVNAGYKPAEHSEELHDKIFHR